MAWQREVETHIRTIAGISFFVGVPGTKSLALFIANSSIPFKRSNRFDTYEKCWLAWLTGLDWFDMKTYLTIITKSVIGDRFPIYLVQR